MLLVNFMGSPGCGKSTTAAGAFFELKCQGWNVELITEYTKELIIKGDADTLADELLVFAEKYRRVAMMKDVDIVITDSPLLNSVIYGGAQFGDAAVSFYKEVAASFDNLYFFLNRKGEYVPFGRMSDEADAQEHGQALFEMMFDEGIGLKIFDNVGGAMTPIVDTIKTEAKKRGYVPFF